MARRHGWKLLGCGLAIAVLAVVLGDPGSRQAIPSGAPAGERGAGTEAWPTAPPPGLESPPSHGETLRRENPAAPTGSSGALPPCSLTVIGELGQPRSGARAFARDGRRWNADDLGRMTLPVGEDLLVLAPDADVEMLRPRPGSQRLFLRHVPPRHLQVVAEADGSAVAGVRVETGDAALKGLPAWTQPILDREVARRAVTDAQGRAVLWGIGLIHVLADGGPRWVVSRLEDAPAEEARIVVLPESPTPGLRYLFVDGDGLPLANRRVEFEVWGAHETALTDAEGRASTTSVPTSFRGHSTRRTFEPRVALHLDAERSWLAQGFVYLGPQAQRRHRVVHAPVEVSLAHPVEAGRYEAATTPWSHVADQPDLSFPYRPGLSRELAWVPIRGQSLDIKAGWRGPHTGLFVRCAQTKQFVLATSLPLEGPLKLPELVALRLVRSEEAGSAAGGESWDGRLWVASVAGRRLGYRLHEAHPVDLADLPSELWMPPGWITLTLEAGGGRMELSAVEIGPGPTVVRVDPVRLGMIQGSVRGIRQGPIPRCEVEILQQGYPLATLETDLEGRFETPVSGPGPYRLRLSLPHGDEWSSLRAEFEAEAWPDQPLELVRNEAALTVLHGHDPILARASLRLRGLDEGGGETPASFHVELAPGDVVERIVPPGDYRAEIRWGREVLRAESLRIAGDRSWRPAPLPFGLVHFDVPRAGELEGTITVFVGPRPGSSVYTQPMKLGTDRALEPALLAPGSYWVTASGEVVDGDTRRDARDEQRIAVTAGSIQTVVLAP